MLDIISDAMFIACAPMAVVCFALILRVLKQIRDILVFNTDQGERIR